MDSLPTVRRARPPASPEDRRRPVVLHAVRTAGAFARLGADWLGLWRADPCATPFQSPHWLLPWWTHIGRGRLATAAVRCADSGELVGLAPLYIHREPTTARRQLLPVGVATSDCLDLLAKPGWTAAVLGALAHHLLASAGEWDVLEFPQLHRDSVLRRLALPAGWRVETAAAQPHPVLHLGGATPWPPRMAQGLRTARSRAARAGTLCFATAGAAQVQSALDALFRLHQRRWNGAGLPGVLADAGVRAAHRASAPLLQDGGLLRLHTLALDGECIAILYCVLDPAPAHERRCYYYIGGFDPQHAAFSPGSLLIAHAITTAQAEGATAFDFLRGAEPYKYRWGARDQARVTLRVWPP